MDGFLYRFRTLDAISRSIWLKAPDRIEFGVLYVLGMSIVKYWGGGRVGDSTVRVTSSGTQNFGLWTNRLIRIFIFRCHFWTFIPEVTRLVMRGNDSIIDLTAVIPTVEMVESAAEM